MNTNSKINILFIIDNLLIGGAGLLTLNLINGFPKSEYKVTLISLNKSLDDSENMNKYVKKDINYIEIDVNIMSFYKKIKTLIKFAKQNDIVHTCLESSNFYGGILSIILKNKVKFISTIHGIDGVFIEDPKIQESFRKNVSRKYYYSIKYIQNYLFKGYDKLFAVSESTMNFLIKKRKVRKEKIKVLYYGLDLTSNRLIEPGKKENIIVLDNFVKNNFIIGYIGRLSNGKGLNMLLDVFHELVVQYKNIKLILVGDGELKSELSCIIKNYGIDDKCYMTGFVSDLKDYYRKINLFVLPSSSEGIPVSLLEALYFRVLTLCSDVGGIPEVIESGKNGFLFKKNNKEEFKNRIKYIIDNFEHLEQIRVNGYERLLNNFILENNLNKIISEFNKLKLK